MVVLSSKSCCPIVPFLHLYQVVCPTEINLGEDSCGVQLIKEARDEGQGVLVLDGDVVEASVVDA